MERNTFWSISSRAALLAWTIPRRQNWRKKLFRMSLPGRRFHSENMRRPQSENRKIGENTGPAIATMRPGSTHMMGHIIAIRFSRQKCVHLRTWMKCWKRRNTLAILMTTKTTPSQQTGLIITKQRSSLAEEHSRGYSISGYQTWARRSTG